jgi:FixJ family two-component response regulator
MVEIIDDDEAVRDSTRALLESYGYQVRDYASAEVYLHDSDSHAHCLLVDQHMPGMTGLDLLEHLRARGVQTPALMITGRSDPTLEPRLSRIGVAVLQKPVSEDQLVSWIERTRTAQA